MSRPDRSPAKQRGDGGPVALATPHHLATAAGQRIARAGGNAVDAALTAAAVLCVVYPHNCSLGGDLLAVLRTANGSTTVVNASGRAPSGLSHDAVGPRPTMPVHGPLTVTVPGVVSGWSALAAEGAALGAHAHLAEAIEMARDGVPVAGSLAVALEEDAKAVYADAGMRGVFAPQGVALGLGDPLVQPKLARTLEQLRDEGADAFYRGALSRRLGRGMRNLGVPVADEDLGQHTADLGQPLSASVAGWSVHTAAPNSQGFVLLRLLRALAAVRRDDRLPLHRAVPADRLAGLFHRTARERELLLADPTGMTIDVRELLAPESVEALVADVVAGGGQDVHPAPARPTGDTVAITAVDAAGNAVSLIQSVFHSFGALLLEPDTGIVLHNRGAAFSVDPRSPNVLAPGKRPAHTLTPVLLESGGDVLSVGTMGGMAQPQILAQVISRLLAGESPSTAVSAPRWVVGGLGIDQPSDTVHWEEDLQAGLQEELARHPGPAVRLPARCEDAGHAQVAALRGGVLHSGSDPRADGEAGSD